MRELFVVPQESTATSLVLRATAGETAAAGTAGEDFFIDLTALDTDARRALSLAGETATTTDQPAVPALAAVDNHVADVVPEDVADDVTPAPVAAPVALPSRPSPERLSLRPPEIQNRIRAGATVSELAAEMGVSESRVEPFAHPVLLERARVAELAKQAHPIREDGPAKLTVFEVLATAFAARGHSLADATWDAYRIKGEPWTVRVSWKTGLSENEATWTLRQSTSSPDVLEPRNTVAADLTDPDFVQPVRSLSTVGRGSGGSRRLEAIDSREEEYVAGFDTPLPNAAETDPAGVAADFLQNPDPQPQPAKRRRKATTPHWEDVLLGVRASTKRPRQ